MTGGAGQNPARQASILSGAKGKPAYIMNQVCIGIRSVALGFKDKVRCKNCNCWCKKAWLLEYTLGMKKLGDIELTDTRSKRFWDAFTDIIWE